MEIGKEVSRTYPLNGESAQSMAYALAEYLDLKKNMITQTMRTKNGYLIQCKGDATAEWTKYLGLDAALSIELVQVSDKLSVSIGFDRWMEKMGIAALGAVIFHPLLITAGIGAIRQAALPQEIFEFIEGYLHAEPIIEEEVPVQRMNEEVRICPACGTSNRIDALFCKACGASLEKKEIHCPSCDTLLEGDEMFCPKCGEKLK